MPLLSWVATIGCWLRQPRSRRRKALGLALLGACAAGSHSAAQTREAPKPIHLSLDADEAAYSDEDQVTSFDGHVRLHATNLGGAAREVTLEADHLRLNAGTGQVETGPVATIAAPKIRLTGENLQYNLRTQALQATKTRVEIRMPVGTREAAFYARSDEVRGSQDKIDLRHASITTCNREHPHYAFVVRKVEVKTGTHQLFLRGASLELWGVRIPLVSKYSTDIAQGSSRGGGLHLPGFSGVDGFWVPYIKRFSGPDDPIQTSLLARLNTSSLLSGSFISEYARPGYRIWGAVARHLEIPDDIHRKLAHDAFPEFGGEFVRKADSSTYSVQVTGGYYRDEILTTGEKSKGVAATARLDWNLLKQSKTQKHGWWAGAGVRGSLYGSGDSYGAIDLRVGAATPLWPRARAELELRHHFVAGQSPFQFDDVGILSEANLLFKTPITRNYSIEATGRYDIDRGKFRDYTLDLARQMHCVTWHLNYRFVTSGFGFSAELTDLIPVRAITLSRPKEKPEPLLPALSPERMQTARHPRTTEATTELARPAEDVPSEFALAEAVRQRAPDAVDPFRRRPPPSLRLAYLPELQ